MSQPSSERRLIENEVVFRQWNETVTRRFEDIKKLANDHGQGHLVQPYEGDIHFYCECADENCRERIRVRLDTYKDIHAARNRFLIIPGHDARNIERIVEKRPEYSVVEKYERPPERAGRLQPTPLNNV